MKLCSLEHQIPMLLIPGQSMQKLLDQATSATGTCVTQSSYHTSDQVVGPPEMGYVSPGEIHSVPKAGPRKTKRSRKKGNTNILTSTPVRNEIALEKKKEKEIVSAKREEDHVPKRHEPDSRGFLRRICN